MSTYGCDDTELYIGDNVIGTAKAVEEGQLLTRYYFVDGGTYTYEKTEKQRREPWRPYTAKAFIWATI